MTREEKSNLLNELLEYEEKNDIGFLTRAERREFQQWISKALEQEPKTGHWIMTSDYLTTAYGSIDYVKCSCCGKDSLEEGDYCPNCGARMVEPQESEE